MNWHDAISGDVGFYMYSKEMYDRIFQYFGFRKKPPPSLFNSFEFLELRKKKFVTKWEFKEGAVKCYHRWWGINASDYDEDLDESGQIDGSRHDDDEVSGQNDGPGQDDDEVSDNGSGQIEFKITNKKMFANLSEYAVKFKP